jgi:hypothetical protein
MAQVGAEIGNIKTISCYNARFPSKTQMGQLRLRKREKKTYSTS